VLPEKFERDEDFSPEDWIDNAFQVHGGTEVVEVSIWFSPEKAQFIRERLWHPSQRIEEGEDGSLILKMKPAGLVEVKNWVLQFGRDAEVLAPKTLREAIRNEIVIMEGKYRDKHKNERRR